MEEATRANAELGQSMMHEKVKAYMKMAQKSEGLWAAALVFLGALALLSAIPFYPFELCFLLALACGAVAYKSPPIGVALGFILILPALSYQSAIFGWVGILLLALVFFEVFENWGEIALLEVIVLLPFALFPLSLFSGLVYFAMVWGSFHFGSAKSMAIAIPAVFTILLLSSIWLVPNSAFFPVHMPNYSPGIAYLQLQNPALSLSTVFGEIGTALGNMADLRAASESWSTVAQIGSNAIALLVADSAIVQLVVWAAVLFFAGWYPGRSRGKWNQTIAAAPLLAVPVVYLLISSVYKFQFDFLMFLYAGISVGICAAFDYSGVKFSRERAISKSKRQKKFGKFGFKGTTDTGETMDSVGGYKGVKKELRDSIMLPLQNKGLAMAYNLRVPSGILLFGPPGTGKTMLMRALANDMDYSFYAVKTPEILSQWYGESEKNLVEVFDRARKTSPSILFFDEIDAIGKKRSMAGTDSVTPRVLNVLLQEMDGMKKSEKQVIVVGATNIPNTLDTALMRPGRFDKIIYMHLPDYDARKEIFKVGLKGLPTSKNIDFDALAKKSDRFSGADIQQVVKTALRRAAEEAKAAGKVIPIRMEHLLGILEHTKPSTSIASVENYEQFKMDFERSEAGAAEAEAAKKEKGKKIGWDDVADLEQVKKAFKEAIEIPLLHPELMEEFKVKPSKGLLLFGPPGTGKTLVVKAASNELDISFLSINGAQLMQKGYAYAVTVIKETFNRARENTPSVIFVDEMETFAPARGMGRGDIVGQFLVEMDGIKGNEGVLVVGATNRPDILDSAILRPGRFDKVIYVPPPDQKGRIELFKIHLGIYSKDLDLESLAKITPGFTGADIASVCQKAKMELLHKKLEGESPVLSTQEMVSLLSQMRPSVTTKMLEKYKAFLKEYGERK
ncbi:AAA family ATPase [Candidatus Micrarchaeota archaeon]|nr:AAA family ATPase [Candidatus Micrarchaeota archaeon]MBD3417391.1 AAA family ATPase [Candidatus Micrarchaeota archaeon]